MRNIEYRREAVMDKKGIRTIWYSIASAFLLTGVFTGKIHIFNPIGFCFIIAGNMRSNRKL